MDPYMTRTLTRTLARTGPRFTSDSGLPLPEVLDPFGRFVTFGRFGG